MRVGPVTFLFVVAGAWAAARTVMLWPKTVPSVAERKIAWARPLSQSPARPHLAPVSSPAGLSLSKPFLVLRQNLSPRIRKGLPQAQPSRDEQKALAWTTPASSLLPHTEKEERKSTGPLRHAPPSPPSRLTISAWALLRGDGSGPLAAGGQLGGSQAGLRARYQLSPALHLATRVSGPLQSNLGKEAAIGLDLRPVRSFPLTFLIERRVGLDPGSRDAFGIGAYGGFDRSIGQVRLDGYAQAGVVGLKRRDLYVDGAVRGEHVLVTSDTARFGVGAGIWGGAQPGAARLDIGPQLVARVPVAAGGVRIGAEWRQRVAGDARPGSGPVLSLGADF